MRTSRTSHGAQSTVNSVHCPRPGRKPGDQSSGATIVRSIHVYTRIDRPLAAVTADADEGAFAVEIEIDRRAIRKTRAATLGGRAGSRTGAPRPSVPGPWPPPLIPAAPVGALKPTYRV
jgi:hypothetical protein